MKSEKTGQKQAGGRFQPGQSGNPKGRPQGSRHKATLAALALLDGEAEALTRRAVEMALEGDTTALRLCLERLIPPRRESPVSFTMPDMTGAVDLPQVTAALLVAAAQGDLTPGEAQALAGLVESHRKALESSELESRVAALEATARKRGKP